MAENIKGETSKKQSKKLEKPYTKRFVEDYWSAALLVIDAAGKYASAIKLKNNLIDPSTQHEVEDVFEKYYSGRMRALDDRIECSKSVFDARVNKFNLYCLQANMRVVKYPDRLLNILLNKEKRVSYKGKIKRRLEKGVICPLQDFEK